MKRCISILIIAVLAVSALTLIGCGAKDKAARANKEAAKADKKAAEADKKAAEADKKAQNATKKSYGIGDTIAFKNFEVTFYEARNKTSIKETGYEERYLRVTVTNTSKSEQTIKADSLFTLTAPNGEKISHTFSGAENALNGKIAPGETKSAEFNVEVPPGTKNIELKLSGDLTDNQPVTIHL